MTMKFQNRKRANLRQVHSAIFHHGKHEKQIKLTHFKHLFQLYIFVNREFFNLIKKLKTMN